MCGSLRNFKEGRQVWRRDRKCGDGESLSPRSAGDCEVKDFPINWASGWVSEYHKDWYQCIVIAIKGCMVVAGDLTTNAASHDI